MTDISGNKSKVEAVGRMGNLGNVLFVPDAQQALISVGAYLDQFGGVIEFTATGTYHRAGKESRHNTRTIGTRREDGLYQALPPKDMPSGKVYLSKKDVELQLMRERIYTLHRMCGHVSKARLKTILANNKVCRPSDDSLSIKVEYIA